MRDQIRRKGLNIGQKISHSTWMESPIRRKKQEGLQTTTKGSKDLAGGRRLQLIAAIGYGRGVICAEPYERMSGTLHVLYGEISPFCLRSLEKMKKSLNCLSWTTIPHRHQQKQSVPCVMRNAKWSKYTS